MAVPDLRQVGALFDDCIAKIREEKHDNLTGLAKQWLKDARYKVMRDIEKEYYQLAATRNQPSQQPRWAIDPSEVLYIRTPVLPGILLPYTPALTANLIQLMQDCGFNADTNTYTGDITIRIRFPARLTRGAKVRSVPKTLTIEDEFSSARSGGFITGSSFAGLIGYATIEEDEDQDDHIKSPADTPPASGSAGARSLRSQRRSNSSANVPTASGSAGARNLRNKRRSDSSASAPAASSSVVAYNLRSKRRRESGEDAAASSTAGARNLRQRRSEPGASAPAIKPS